MPGGKAQITWSAEADRKLFLSILEVHDVKINYDAVAARMATDDSKPTGKSISHRMAKLKAMASKECGASRSAESATEMTPRPKGRKRASAGGGDSAASSAKKACMSGQVKMEEILDDVAGTEQGGDNDGELL